MSDQFGGVFKKLERLFGSERLSKEEYDALFEEIGQDIVAHGDAFEEYTGHRGIVTAILEERLRHEIQP